MSVIVEASQLGLRADSIGDVSDLVGNGFGTDGVVITEQELGPDFFALQTGLAGELFQKFAQYRVRLAVVVADPASHGERFAELSYEHRSHPQVRVVHSVDAAYAWLAGDG